MVPARVALRRVPILKPSYHRAATTNAAFSTFKTTPRLLTTQLGTKTRQCASQQSIQSYRAFSTCLAQRQQQNKPDVAPTAQAYLASGAIAGGQNLVDVTKVLVIGSGGLSIGQAGEFDYSGKCLPSMNIFHLSGAYRAISTIGFPSKFHTTLSFVFLLRF